MLSAAPLAFLFFSPLTALVVAAGAVSVPIVIHLLSRRRYRVVTWAAMRFLLAAQKQTVRKMRLEQYLLLGVRCLLLLLLVLAMASVTPWAEALWYKLFPDSAVLAAAGAQRTHKIIVLDGSFSMGLKGGDNTCFDRARARAAHILESAPGGDGFSVILMAAPPRGIVPEPSEDSRRVGEEIQRLRLPHGNADVAATLHMVDEIVRTSPGKFEAREVYFMTDMQRSTWLALPSVDVTETLQRVQANARVVFVDVGQESAGNLAVTNMTLGASLATTGTPIPVSATIHNFGAEEGKPVRAELLVGKARTAASDPPFEMRIVEQKLEAVPAGRAGLTVSFMHKFTAPGEYALQVRIENDALALDDSRYFVVTVKDAVPVMLVNGKPAVKPPEQATFFLDVALNPYKKGTAPRDVPARPKIVSESQFADATLGDLTAYDCVYLCDVARLGTAEVHRLENHLRQGGGVVFFLGPRVDLEAYNRLIYRNAEGILPARLLGVQRAPQGRTFTFYAEEDTYKRPPIEAFVADHNRAGLLGARFAQYIRTELPSRSRARKVLSFMPDPVKLDGPPRKEESLPVGDPAIVEWSKYRGRVILLTTTANGDWTFWPGSPSYASLMQELLPFAVAGRLREQASLVGEPLEGFLQSGSAGLEVTIQTPDGRTEHTQTQAQDDTVVLRHGDTDQSGIYRMTIGQNPREHLFAVNVPTATEGQQASESDLARVTREDELRSAFPSVELQLVTDPKKVVRAPAAATGEGPRILRGMGATIARMLLLILFVLLLAETLLAWLMGHHSKSTTAEVPPVSGRMIPLIVGATAALIFLALAGVLVHTARTGDFLGFLPEALRQAVESALDVPAPVAGESTKWRLEYTPFLLRGSPLEPWLVGAVAVGSVFLIVGVYWREGRTATFRHRMLLAGLRVFLVLLALVVLLPQLQLWFERQGWPDIAIIIDDSQSMSHVDQYRDPRVKEAAEKLAGMADLSAPQRLQLAQALLTRPETDWLGEFLSRRKMKVHVYHCSSKAARIADMTRAEDRNAAAKAVQDLSAKGESSQLGSAVREVLERFRGSSLSAIVMMTDGVTTDGEDLVAASRHAAQMNVPLYFVGIGDAQDVRDLILHDLQVEDTVFVNDRLVFEARLKAQGYANLPAVPIALYEKTQDGQLVERASERVTIDPQGKPVKFRLSWRPKEAGEKTFVIKIKSEDLPPDVQHNNSMLERTIFVREAKPSRVLYIEGYPRPEFRFLKTLLEREGANEQGQKTIDLKVLLLDAQEDWHLQDKSARPDFPTKEELNQFDVVILGDVDLKHAKMGEKNVRLLVDFVRERGGGLLLIAGKRDNPRSYKDSPLADVLPIQVAGGAPMEDPDASRIEGFRPALTPLGRLHPIFRFNPDETENAAIWNHLAETYWFSEGYRLQPAAEVLAVHPRKKAAEPMRPGAGGDERHPLIVQHFVGSGRCLFLGIEETWAWAFREDMLRFNQFWVQMVNYLARNRLGRIDLRLDRQTPYRRGEPIKVMVRFPDDQPPPGAGSEVKVMAERRPLDSRGPVETEVQTLQLAKLEGSRASYEALLTRTPEGEYRFWLSAPPVSGTRPRVECRVLLPPGEMERLRMNQPDMERAAEETHGRFYNLADAPRLLDELPSGSRVVTSSSGPPWLLWNHFAVFFLAIGLIGTEWVLRKRKHLL
ncbi:MAG: VWA domain-containing protein [Gemmataceae bacterium]|nr:VWA domain-containing protein [Gemmataceae bacterium]